jgi:hypothetical protein
MRPCGGALEPIYGPHPIRSKAGAGWTLSSHSGARSSAGEHYLDMVGVTGSIPVAPTIQSFQTADLRAGSKDAVSVGIFAGIIPLVRSLVTLAVSQADFSLPFLHPKIPFPAAGFPRPIPFGSWEYWECWEAKTAVLSPVRNYRGFSPRTSNCRLHSAGASRSRSTPMPRGKRPSTAARTRSGARNASESVMLT